jgi:hypothetical protein
MGHADRGARVRRDFDGLGERSNLRRNRQDPRLARPILAPGDVVEIDGDATYAGGVGLGMPVLRQARSRSAVFASMVNGR